MPAKNLKTEDQSPNTVVPAGEEPPVPPRASERDRGTFKRRVRKALDRQGLSQRRLEDRAGRPRAHLSKVFSGRVKLSHSFLAEVCQVLKVEPHELVEGTAFEVLLETAPPTVESEAAAQHHAEADELRRQIASLTAELEAQADQAARTAHALGMELRKAQDEHSELQLEHLSLQARLELTQDRANRAEGAIDAHKGRTNEWLVHARKLEAERDEALRQATGWRTSYLNFAARNQQLQRALKASQAHAAQIQQAQLGENAGVALLGGLLGFSAGAVLNELTK